MARPPGGRPAAEAYVDGRFLSADAPGVAVSDRGFLLGDGLFETVRIEAGEVRHVEAHLARLASGVALLGLTGVPDEATLVAALLATARRNRIDPAVARLTITRGGTAGRGLLPPRAGSRPTVAIQAFPLPAGPAGGGPPAVAVILASTRRNEHSPLARIKSTSCLDMVLARMEAARQGADDALVLNTAGRLACGSAANLFVVEGDRLLTPPLAEGVLPGVTRGRLLAGAAALGLRVEERPIGLETLAAADEALLTNTVIPARAVVRVVGRPLGSGQVGPVAARIAAWL